MNTDGHGSMALERMRRRNEEAVRDMEAEEAAGRTCGAPHRSLVRGLRAVMENQIDDAESRSAGTSREEAARRSAATSREEAARRSAATSGEGAGGDPAGKEMLPAGSGRTVKVGPLTFTNLTQVDLVRVLIILGILYLIGAHIGIFPSRMGRRGYEQPPATNVAMAHGERFGDAAEARRAP